MDNHIPTQLIQFDITNYRSIKDTLSFSMVAGKSRKNTIYSEAAGVHLLRSSVIYGANASGKSNVIRALYFLVGLIEGSAILYDKDIFETDPEPFMLDDTSRDKPTRFELHLAHGDKVFVYTVEFDNKNKTIAHERLRVKYPVHTSPATIYTREGDSVTVSRYKADDIKHGITSSHTELLETDKLFVTTLSGLAKRTVAHEFVTAIGFCRVYNANVHEPLHFISRILREADKDSALRDIKDQLITFLGIADFSIVDLQLKTDDGQERIYAVHRYKKASGIQGTRSFALEDESHGTRKFIANLFPLIGAITLGGVYVADELDSPLHSSLLRYIVKLFNNSSSGAQLITTSHDVTLMDDRDDFTTDQIRFIEKRPDNSSEIYSLSDFPEIRNTTPNLSKRYLHGEFGANPNIQQTYNIGS